jgi:hypothetical protein
MRKIILFIAVLVSNECYSQKIAMNVSLPKSQVVTSAKNGKPNTNVWSIKNDKWLYFNDKIYEFERDTLASTLTKTVGWVIIAGQQYRIVLFSEITAIEIYNNKGQRTNIFE